MTFATASDGARLWYLTRGDHGDAIVLIAGLAVSHAGWLGVIDRFAAGHRVVVFDHRGVGRSDDSFGVPWSTRDFAADVVAVLDAAGVDRAHVYGHSMGGRIAQWLAADAPERVGALALGGTTVGDRHGVIRPQEATDALASGNRDALLDFFFTPEWIPRNPDAAEAALPNARSREARRIHFGASAGHDGWSALPRIVSPTLVIHGRDDILCPPQNARILADHIAGARLRLIERARHGYYVEVPESSDDVLEHFERHRLGHSPTV
ncbi:alpha/beta fold hydrolase [Glaciibacter sp. 2TAF33]|uniref:alpha/beta fold hydrolase n=1 Tax=Glaciibacter sp. 2TAF33 TaxID=3233015 RepID=UPI003F932A37